MSTFLSLLPILVLLILLIFLKKPASLASFFAFCVALMICAFYYRFGINGLGIAVLK